MRIPYLTIIAAVVLAVIAAAPFLRAQSVQKAGSAWRPQIVKSDAEWRKLLTPEQYEVLRAKGTERAFTGKNWNNHAPGTYRCVACGNELFSSDTKFESGTGWPSFWTPLRASAVHNNVDRTFGMERTEVLCARCGGHLGHVFDDGPKPTGLRYCMNAVALRFVPAPKK